MIGDPVEYYNPETDTWRQIIITHTTASCLRRDPDYYNYKDDEGIRGSVHLTKHSLWRHRHILVEVETSL